ncbi:hypothetical protein niasHS_008780 [Heterodera schachtii]|uniref:B30.2/SPRY domain-containing protein n=1 Tax=Heterodera schachtii TaxID=97005 RepID=A0ABD2J7M2_HETSC
MSISTASTISDDFSSDDCANGKSGDEVNYDELFTFVKERKVVKTNGTDQQQLKELSEKYAKMELILKINKLELKNKRLQEKLKQQETNALLAKIEAENGKMKNEIEKIQEKLDTKEEEHMDKKLEELQEQLDKKEKQHKEKLEELQKNQKAFQAEHEKKLMEQIVTMQAKVDKMEMEHQQQKVSVGQIEQLQKLQKEQNIKINALEKNQAKMAFLNFRQNCWDANACHYELKINTANPLKVYAYEGGGYEYHTVFATHPVSLDMNCSEIFYFEIRQPNTGLVFGFAVKQPHKLEGSITDHWGTYAYFGCGDFTVNGEYKIQIQEDYSFGDGDVVGCGINLGTRQVFFTKNGCRLDSFDLADHSPQLFPFISLWNAGEEIEANFGPKFLYNFDTTF